MDPRIARPNQPQTSKLEVAVLLAKGKLVGCLTTSQSRRSGLDASDINKFHDTLQVAIRDSTPHISKEFKKCVAWIVCHVAKSRRRVVALGYYLVKLSESYESQISEQGDENLIVINAQARINLLHLLDAISVRIRENPGHLLRKPLETYTTFAEAIEPSVVSLVQLAAPIQGVRAMHLHQALAQILAHWSQALLFTKRIRLNLRKIARTAYMQWLDWLQNSYPAYHDKLIITTSQTELYAELPSMHGSSEDAWYDLPVATMVQTMKSTKPGCPLKTSQLKPLSMPRGPVDPDMMTAVLEHIEECKKVTAVPNISTASDQEEFILNGLGLRVSRNSLNGGEKPKLKLKEGYYGFNVPFMKAFEKIDQHPPTGPEKPIDWIPPPPRFYGAPPPFPAQNIIPPPMRDAPYNGGGGFRNGDNGRGNGGGWRGEHRGGTGSWRGPPRGRGGGGGGRGWGGGGYRPY